MSNDDACNNFNASSTADHKKLNTYVFVTVMMEQR